MGTRSLTTFAQQWKDEKTDKVKTDKIVTMYRHTGGYPTGHGLELAEFLASGKMVNGIGMTNDQRVFNGVACLTAQAVHGFKGTEAGGIYLHRGGTINCGEDYRYEVIWNENTQKLTMRCLEVRYKKGAKEIFNGTAEEFIAKYKEVEEPAVVPAT